MRLRLGPVTFLVLIALLGALVWHSAQTLPAVVASHFAASGRADGYLPRATYAVFITALVVGVPLLLALFPAAAIRGEGRTLNLPHRDYWLAPQRCAQTIGYLRAQGRWLALIVALFLGHVHWLVVQAHQLQPPVLSSRSMVAALLVFVLVLLLWLRALVARFRRSDRPRPRPRA